MRPNEISETADETRKWLLQTDMEPVGALQEPVQGSTDAPSMDEHIETRAFTCIDTASGLTPEASKGEFLPIDSPEGDK